MDDDKYRQKFCAWATGSIYSNATIYITLNNYKSENKPFNVHTCHNRIDIYQTDPNPLYDIGQLEAQINSNTKNLNFSLL